MVKIGNTYLAVKNKQKIQTFKPEEMPSMQDF